MPQKERARESGKIFEWKLNGHFVAAQRQSNRNIKLETFIDSPKHTQGEKCANKLN